MTQNNQGSDNAQQAFSSAMQHFMQAGQAMAQGFMTTMKSAQPGTPSGGIPALSPLFDVMQQAFSGFQGMPGNSGSTQGPFGASPFNLGAPGAIPGLPPGIEFPDHQALLALQKRYADMHAKLWGHMVRPQEFPSFRVEPDPGDRRFQSKAWRESPVYDYLWQAYVLNGRYLNEVIDLLPVSDTKGRDRLRFVARQYIDAMSPANFAATNPEFVQTALESKGQSITDGINNLIKDMEKGRISMTDESVFEIGRNIASSEGGVVFENPLIQLIQYAPLTEKVGSRPLLIVPPAINKFYILDLQPENSLVRFAVEQGHTVFLVSWKNPKEAESLIGWDDYLNLGVITPIDVVRKITKNEQINALGFCVGGTLLGAALAVLRGRGENPVASLTLLTTMLDFSDTGDIGLIIDENFVALKEQTIGSGGLLRGQELASTFSMLRPNDLIWNYVANNYLKGQKPAPFDLLYWNSDSTNLPGPMMVYYLRHMYLENSLKVPGKLVMCGVPADLGKIDMPSYLLAAREDHIVPWTTAFQTTRLFSGPVRFVLGASGHIAGVVNPASKNKRSFWVEPESAPSGQNVATPQDWLTAAREQPGSWWNDWAKWLSAYAGKPRSARKQLGDAQHPVLEPAPGRYVRERA